MPSSEPMTATEVCPCSEVEQCDCHACCGECPDNPLVWCGECWDVGCKVHSWPERDVILRTFGRNESGNSP